MARSLADRLGTLTDAQRARKMARAARLVNEAADLLDEVYRDRRDNTYRMTLTEQSQHYDIGRCAGAVEAAAETLRLTGITPTLQG